jgi:ZIP family zinc transporter
VIESIIVAVEELMPESQTGSETDYSPIGAILGFAIMLFLDVSLG